MMRAFKTGWFTKAAMKAGIKDSELCEAIEELKLGQAENLGGGVYKKRLNKNRHRIIILARGRNYWIYQYLFAKKDRSNIEETELDDFRSLAKGFASLSFQQVALLLVQKDLVEICNEKQNKI